MIGKPVVTAANKTRNVNTGVGVKMINNVAFGLYVTLLRNEMDIYREQNRVTAEPVN